MRAPLARDRHPVLRVVRRRVPPLRQSAEGGAAATASSAPLGVVYVVHITLSTALAYSIAGTGNTQVTSGLNDLSRLRTGPITGAYVDTLVAMTL